ncbi:MAG: acetate kinase [Bacteroidaceae bacterium]|nr:acetate kinase [Bacteroidaceae bacterium]
MKVLLLNCGSSSIKYKLYDMSDHSVMAAGGIEKIGSAGSFIKTKLPKADKTLCDIPDHNTGVQLVLQTLTSPVNGCIHSLDEIDAVGDRIVHGGPFSESTLLTPEIFAEWKKCALGLAPVHSEVQAKSIEAISKCLPNVPQVGIFDTAFHQTIPEHAYLTSLPYEFYEKYGIRRYGFHGTSFRYVLQRSAQVLGFNANEKRIIICHIGNGISVSAIKEGVCIDTTMGMMPNDGPMMGTRTGDMDASALLFLMEKENLTPAATLDLISKNSGLLGISGLTNDMREIVEAAQSGHSRAQLALDMYCYRLKRYIGAYAAILGGVDYIIFTAGVGENQPPVRKGCLEGLEFMGVQLDIETNEKVYGQETVISTPDSKVTVAVIPTDEELMMAQDTMQVVTKQK